jgi:D-alanyl-D-alanine carboxypeptidase (penicillin-binding protein 5/6)
MNHAALALMLVLQTTGIWGNISTHARSEIIDATGGTNQSSPKKPIISTTPLPNRIGSAELDISADGAFAIDRLTSISMFEKTPNSTRPIASITKIMTVLTVLSRHKPDELVTIGELPTYNPDAETLGLQPGQTFELSDLISAALIPSANDAADAIAIYDSGSITKFTAQMNLKLRQWGIKGANFASASGLVDTNNYASPIALTKIGGLALTNPTIKKLVNEQSGSITSNDGQIYNFVTTNKLLATDQFYGIKTGYTLQAGECFVGLARINGHDVITVILGSNDRFGDTLKLTNWIGNNWQWL